MNKHNAHLYLPLVQALAEGKTIQTVAGEEWRDIKSVAFHEEPERYRVKPEPAELEGWYNPNPAKDYRKFYAVYDATKQWALDRVRTLRNAVSIVCFVLGIALAAGGGVAGYVASIMLVSSGHILYGIAALFALPTLSVCLGVLSLWIGMKLA